MGALTKEHVVRIIEEHAGLSREEIERRISEIAEREGISEHAAAVMLAEELGVDLEGREKLLELKDLVPGMSGANVVVGVLRKYPVREYSKKDGSKGLVANILVYDSSGKSRLVLWNGFVTKYYNSLNPGDIIKVIDPSIREGRNGIELHTYFRTRIIHNPEDPRVEKIPPIQEVRSYNYQRRRIGELMGGERFVEVRGTVARLYRVTVYDACPQCRKKVDYDPSSETWICPDHGEVEPIKITIVDFGLDDSTGYIRTTLFGDDAAEFVGAEPEEIDEKLKALLEDGLTLRDAGRKLAEEEFYHLLGREVVIRGNAVDDKFLGLLLKAFGWEDVDPRAEIPRVRAELNELLKEVV